MLLKPGGLASAFFAASVLLPLGLLVQPAWAARATVVLNDGRTFEGDLVEETAERVVLSISGIQTPFARDDVKELKVAPNIREQFEERRKNVQDTDLAGRLELTNWLFNQGEYQLAQQEVSDLRTRFPQDERVRTLEAAIQSRQSTATADEPTRRPGTAGTAGDRADRRAPAERPTTTTDGLPLLDDRQINRVKVWELPEDLSQTQVRIVVPREVIERALAQYPNADATPKDDAGRRRLIRGSAQEQLGFLFALGREHPEARELYGEVEVAGDPEAMVGFRRTIYPTYFQRYFRPTFGEGQVPGFQLVPNNPNTNAEVYSNFAILSTADVDGEPMIDRQSPEDSLLLQWGLPRESARRPAPNTPGWRPFFSGRDDRNFRDMVAWIDSLYDTGAVDYGFEYPPESDEDEPAEAAPQPNRSQAPPQPDRRPNQAPPPPPTPVEPQNK